MRNDDAFRKVVALKVISPGTLQPDIVERFRQERQILAGLDHDNIARILDGGATDDGRPYYVMEYVDGSPIDEYCDRARANVRERVRLLAQVCDAVQYLHDNAVIHRDLKPGNVLVTGDGRAKLLDFGIAKLQGAGLAGGTTKAGYPTMLMTPVYASPEQIEGREITRSTDIYSLGVILYKLLTGRLPYVNEDGTSDVAAKLAGPEPERPSARILDLEKRTTQNAADFRRSVQGELDLIVLAALRADPFRRYESAKQFGEDLRRFLEGRPVLAKADTVLYRFRKFLGRNRIAATLSAVLAVAMLVSAGVGLQVQIEKVRVAAKEQEIERYLALLSTRLDRWEPGADSKPVPQMQKLADLRRVNEVLTSDIPRLAASTRGDPVRVKRLVGATVRLLDRAERLSEGDVPLRQEIVTGYRQAGDLQVNPRMPRITDREQAISTYQKAAVVASSIGAAHAAWMRTQLAELERRLQALGSELATRQSPATSAVAEERVRQLAQPIVVPPVARPPQDNQAPTDVAAVRVLVSPSNQADLSEILQRLSMTTSRAQQARRNLDSLQARLAEKGQVVHADTTAAMARVEASLKLAQSALTGRDAPSALEHVRRAEYDLKRVFQAVGN
jgi:hypothetical protein